jgi:hypothetical protein
MLWWTLLNTVITIRNCKVKKKEYTNCVLYTVVYGNGKILEHYKNKFKCSGLFNTCSDWTTWKYLPASITPLMQSNTLFHAEITHPVNGKCNLIFIYQKMH